MKSTHRFLFLSAATLLLTACGTSRMDQLERVAKDWCETIRASQVIPVYPLTEDLQPGDVFLVQVPVDRQQEIYKQKGFLPLDNHLARLDPKHYGDFYDYSFYERGAKPYLPREWMRPGGQGIASWEPAPNAAFPTYSFSVSRSAGMNMAIPISGVPVGLSLLGTQSANGSVTIDDARTLGIDTISLHTELQDWIDSDTHVREFIANFASEPGQPPRNFLRVVTRVYATGRVSVQLNDAKSISGSGDAGVARPVDLFLAKAPNGPGDTIASNRENYQTGLANINNMGGNLGGPPTHSSGDHSGLSAGQLATISKSERDARDKEATDRKKDAKDRQDDLDKADKAAKESQEYKDLDTAKNTLAAAEKALAEKQLALDKVQAEANKPGLSADERAAAQQKVPIARAERDDADKAVNEGREKVATAQSKYDSSEKANAVVEAKGRLNVANEAVKRLEQFAPGASVRFTAASSRSISMEEDFNPPLIIGYLGFDVGIGEGGELGRPIPTYAIIDKASGLNAASAIDLADKAFVDPGALSESVELALHQRQKMGDQVAERAVRRLDRLAVDYVPTTYSVYSVVSRTGDAVTLLRQTVKRPAAPKYKDYVAWLGKTRNSMQELEQGLASQTLKIKADAAGADEVQTADNRKTLAATLDALGKSLDSSQREREDRQARRESGRYYAELLLMGAISAE